MAPIDLDPNPAGGHSADRTIGLADAVSGAVRALTDATRTDAGLPDPSTIDEVVTRLQAGAAGMDQLARQLAGRLTEIAATEELRVSHGMVEPSRAVADALDELERVQRAAAALKNALRYAHDALSPIGIHYTAGDDLEEDDLDD